MVLRRADSKQLHEISKLIKQNVIRAVVFHFDQMNETLEYVETGSAKGKVVVK
ncbi:zinc-binding dehydrogenase [Pedobacter cryoconitis]|uniref:zinc-binding dehydrogenase n=1 Tax=Pedobacter cryoconitis TaxID=188932 RepID=UPI0009FF69D4